MKQESHKEGAKVWKQVQLQWQEAVGFFAAAFFSFFDFIRKYGISCVLFGLIAAGIVYLYLWSKPLRYSAEMTVSYVYLEKKIYADRLEKLDRLLQNKNFSQIAQLLNIPVEDAKKLHLVASFNIKREPLIDELSTDKVPFYIKVEVNDSEVLPQLETALIHYLNEVHFVKERLQYAEIKAKEDLAFYEKRLQINDSLSALMLLSKTENEEPELNKQRELFEESNKIYDKIQETKGSLAFNKNIEVLDGFVLGNQVKKAGEKNWIVLGFLAGVLFRIFTFLLYLRPQTVENDEQVV